MDFRFAPEQLQLIEDVQDFFRVRLPADWHFEPFEIPDERWEFAQKVTTQLGERSWLTPGWPKEYGGAELDHISRVILAEQMSYHRAPNTTIMGATLVGPTLLVHGTEEQKRAHLPEIASGEASWCQGYSEPNAGSDLAAVETVAVRDGDAYVLNGSKIWCSYAHRAKWCFLLARTDTRAARHKGLGYFLLPMHSDGVEVVRLTSMAGMEQFCQLYFDNVRVPVENRVGAENEGWYVAMTTLNFERSSIASVAGCQRDFDDFVAWMNSVRPKDERDSEVVNRLLSKMAVEIEVGRLLSYRVASEQALGGLATLEASSAKLYMSEMAVRHSAAYLRMLEMYGLLWEGAPQAPMAGRFGQLWLNSSRLPLVGGTSEIQRNIIAQRGLQLSATR